MVGGGRYMLQALVSLIIFCNISVSLASTTQIEKAREFYQQGQFQLAYDALTSIELKEQDSKRLALIFLFRGIVSSEMRNYTLAEEELTKSYKLRGRLEDYALYYRGKTYMAKGDRKKAREDFLKIDQDKTSSPLYGRSRFELAELYLASEDWSNLREELLFLEKKFRSEDFYPDVLWKLMLTETKLGHRRDICRWAGTLYERYPTYEKVKDWGIDLNNNTFEKEKLPCSASVSDQKSRVRRLQWEGASEKALAEINELKSRASTKKETFEVDNLLAYYLVNEGHVDNALKILIPYFESKKTDAEYLNLLARTAAAADNFNFASAAYDQVYELQSKGSGGAGALYSSAFLSYQYQDYDSALVKFQKLIKRHKGSSLYADSRWLVAWIKYLKSSYSNALEDFNEIEREIKVSRHAWRQHEPDKIQYWKGMTYLRLGRTTEAAEIFSKISNDDQINYYAVAAFQRLSEMSSEITRGLATVSADQKVPVHENWWFPQIFVDPVIKKSEMDSQTEGDRETNAEDDIQKGIKRQIAEDVAYDDLDLELQVHEYRAYENPIELLTSISGQEFSEKFERSRELAMIGNFDMAKWELFDVEKKTKDKENLKTLMFEYHRLQAYNRSSYIGSVYFASLRAHLGIHQGASLWEFVYPEAFSGIVRQQEENFKVPKEFIWSIMKAETSFRADAVSPVGARGLMQMMPHTGRKVASLMGENLDPSTLAQPQVNIKLGASYLQRLLKKFSDHIPLAAAAYNGGPHRVQGWVKRFGHLNMDEFIEHVPYLETRNYVKKVVRYYSIYNLLYNKKVTSSNWLVKPIGFQFDGTVPTQETWEAL